MAPRMPRLPRMMPDTPTEVTQRGLMNSAPGYTAACLSGRSVTAPRNRSARSTNATTPRGETTPPNSVSTASELNGKPRPSAKTVAEAQPWTRTALRRKTKDCVTPNKRPLIVPTTAKLKALPRTPTRATFIACPVRTRTPCSTTTTPSARPAPSPTQLATTHWYGRATRDRMWCNWLRPRTPPTKQVTAGVTSIMPTTAAMGPPRMRPATIPAPRPTAVIGVQPSPKRLLFVSAMTASRHTLSMALLAGSGYTVEKVNDSSVQRILGSDDEEPILLDGLLKDFRSMSQMVGRDADVRPNGLPHESIRLIPEFRHQQRFHGWPDTVNDRSEVP